MTTINENKLIQVCDHCLTAACWYGEYYCDYSKNAGLTLKTVKELRKLNRENEEYWSDEKMEKIYGEPNPFRFATPGKKRERE
jgi:hypothetical protein